MKVRMRMIAFLMAASLSITAIPTNAFAARTVKETEMTESATDGVKDVKENVGIQDEEAEDVKSDGSESVLDNEDKTTESENLNRQENELSKDQESNSGDEEKEFSENEDLGNQDAELTDDLESEDSVNSEEKSQEESDEETAEEESPELFDTREAVEEYITMTEGQELHQTDGTSTKYVFAPEESGYYRLSCKSINGQDFALSAKKTVYYTVDEDGNKVQHEYNPYESLTDYDAERVMWLNSEEEYVFSCSSEGYYDTDEYDYVLKMDKVEIAGVETVQNPKGESYNTLDYTGLQVKINYTDGTYSLSNVRSNIYSNESYCYIEVFDWSSIACDRQRYISPAASLKTVDGMENADFSALTDGTHAAVLCIEDYGYSDSSYYEFQIEFVVKRGNIASIEVRDPETVYTQGFQEVLGYFELIVTYNDGTADKTIPSSSSEVSQCLKYTQETEQETVNIDTYLQNGGKLGEAEVWVSYRGSETSYKITIEENPYERMEVIPKRTTYYTGCGYTFGDSTYGGDYLSGDDFRVTLYRKDGAAESYDEWYELPNYWRCGNYGLELKEDANNNFYKDIDDFIDEGGTVGEQTLTVSYGGLEASCQITLEANPYDHVSIAALPEKVNYVHNRYANLDFNGMTIYAYKDAGETEYDVYNYSDYLNYNNDNPGNIKEEQYYIMGNFFRAMLGGHESIEYLELGTHTVSVFLMGHETSYDIEVVDKLVESITVTQTPEKLTYYAGDNSELSLYGMVIEIKDLQGNVKSYKYCNDGSDYEDWWDISDEFSYSSNINYNKPGNYNVTVSYLGAEDVFEVTILENPIESVQITKLPDKTSYYQYESDSINLSGLEYLITYKDGTAFSGAAGEYSAYFTYNGERFTLSNYWKVTIDGEAKLGDNAIVVSAMGVKGVTDTIAVKEDPVKSLEIVKNPEKLQYIDRDNKIDLYGMELLITYVDGSSENIKFEEHVSSQALANECGGTITASLGERYIDGKNQKYLEIFYRNANCYIVLPSVDLSAIDHVEIADEGYYYTALTKDKPYSVYSFTPSETKSYNFFSTGTYDSYVVLYEGNVEVSSDDDGGESTNFKLKYELTAGKTYYYVVSGYSFGSEGDFNCYFSSTVESFSDLTVTDLEITQTPKTVWYDFESGTIWADDLTLYETECELTYSNGWKQITNISSYSQSTTVGGIELAVKWKYTVEDEDGDIYVEKREDNALVYTYGEKVIEFPLTFDVSSPVESLIITNNPWENQKIYEYQTDDLFGVGLAVTIHYNDGREDETVVWDDAYYSLKHNGYYMRLNWKDFDVQPEKENTVVLSYMGKTAEIPVMVLENPVESMQLVKQPEKTEYYPFEDAIDLYGAKILITYKDGTMQTAEAVAHGSSLDVPGAYAEKLSAGVRYTYDEDDNETEICYVSYMGYRQDIMPYKTRVFTTEASIPLTEDEEKEIVLEGDGAAYQVFSFTPSETGNYRFQYSCNDYDYENYIRLYNGAGNRQLSSTWRNYLTYEMTGGKQYFLVIVVETATVQNYTCTLIRQPDTPRENVGEVNLSVNNPVAGRYLADMYYDDYDEYYVSEYSWLNDAGNDEIADYGTAHRLMLILKPYSSYQFSSSTKVTVNGSRVVSKSVRSDGQLALYYTFPYTQCRVTVPAVDGFELDESQNTDTGMVNYGEDYKFRYIKNADNTDNDKLIVKANDTVLTPNDEGDYVIEKVTENIDVIAKNEGVNAGSDESKLTFYNKSADIYDILVGKQNAKIADNESKEKTLPTLSSYVNGSDQFFFGWYLDKDADFNGRGTRFTSQSVLLNPSYELFAKWGSGIFSYTMNNKQVNYKILSIDEYNKTKVQVGDGSSKAVKGAVFTLLRAAGSNDVLVIPEKIDLNNNTELTELGIDFSDCEVIAIAENAFAGEEGIRNVTLPDTIESIGNGAFSGCTALEEVAIPEGVSRIGESAFSGCENLQSVSIPSSVDKISEGTFQGCTSLNSVSMAEGVSEIGAGAFEGCQNLTTIVLPDTIETIDESAFTVTESQNLTIICSNEMKESDTIKAVQESTGATVVGVDVELDCISDEKQFTCGDGAQTFTASVRVDNNTVQEREIVWTYPVTTAYDFTVSANKKTLTVMPGRVTTDDENIIITATDKESGKSKSITLKTVGIDLEGMDGDNEDIYSIKEIETQSYTGVEICPEIVVVNNITKEVLSAENYDISFENNIYVGTASVTVTGKGNYRGSLCASFVIDGTEKKEQFITAFDITKTKGDVPFNIKASTSGDGSLSYKVADTKVATIDDKGTITIVGAGTTEITITASETDRFYKASKTIMLTVKAPEKMVQSIKASNITKTYGDADFKVGASTTGDGTLSYESSNTKVIKVNAKNGMAQIIGAGTANIVIKASATETYNGASTTITVTVKKASVKLSVGKKSYEKVYGDKPFNLKVSAKTAVSYKTSNSKVAVVKNGKVTIKGCGTVTITVSAGNANYVKASQKITIKVVPKKAVIGKVKSKKARQMTVTWKKQKEASGYLVEYSTDKKFKKNVKTVNISKNKTTSTTIKKLSKGKKYYVRVKAYTKINKKKVCGKASKVLNVKIKK